MRTFRPAALALLLLPVVAHAAVIRVPDDQPSVLAALDLAASGDSVLVAPGIWTHKELRLVNIGGEYEWMNVCGLLKGGVTLIGEAGPEVTLIDAQDPGSPGVSCLVYVNSDEMSVVEGLGFAGARTAIIGVWASGLQFSNCIFRGNHTVIKVTTCDLAMIQCVVEGNTQPEYTIRGRHVCSIELEQCRFEANVGAAALFGDGVTDVTVRNCEFIGHRTAVGGALALAEATVHVEGNLFLRNTMVGPNSQIGGGLKVSNCIGPIRFNTFAYDSALGTTFGGGLGILDHLGEVSNNTFYQCHADWYGGALYVGASTLTVDSNVFSHSTGSYAVMWPGEVFNAGSGCNLYWANTGGDVYNDEFFPTDIWADPLYCDPENLDFTVAANSPCLPGATPDCGQIGAWGEGCGGVSVEATSWGMIKSLYR